MAAENPDLDWESDDDRPLNEAWESDDDLPLVQARNLDEIDDENGENGAENENVNDNQAPTEPGIGKKWTETLTENYNVLPFQEETGPATILAKEKKELDFFHQLFPQEMYENIARETNRYAAKQQQIANRVDPIWYDTNATEIRVYIGLLIVMSVIDLPNSKMYWAQQWLFKFPSFAAIFTRHRFDKLNQYFHINETTHNPAKGQPNHDPLCHVRPFHDLVLANCLAAYKPHRDNTIDEAMIAYKGRLSFKQYLPAKPTKFGIKVWERADAHNGYVSEFQVYTGKVVQADGTRVTEIGLGGRVVHDLTRQLIGKHYHIYTDNYFTGIPLYEDLLKDGIYACGTIRANRKQWPATLHPKLLKKQGEAKVLQREQLVATSWHDNRQVNFLSTNSNPTEQTHIERRQKNGDVKIVDAPIAVANYQAYMAGVDRADQLRTQYSCSRKAKKYWKYLFAFLLDICIVNAFLLFRMSPNHVRKSKSGRVIPANQLDFRQNLATLMIGDYRVKRKRCITNVDRTGNEHWPTKMKKNRCKVCLRKEIRREVVSGYETCKVNLCLECFRPFHAALETF